MLIGILKVITDNKLDTVYTAVETEYSVICETLEHDGWYQDSTDSDFWYFAQNGSKIMAHLAVMPVGFAEDFEDTFEDISA